MKTIKIIYWITTVLFCLMMSFSAFMYFTNPEAATGFQHLGYPRYFMLELGIAKIIGVLVLIVPAIPFRFKEWAYVAFIIVTISAFIAHVASGDPASMSTPPLVATAIALSSWIMLNKIYNAKLSQQAA